MAFYLAFILTHSLTWALPYLNRERQISVGQLIKSRDPQLAGGKRSKDLNLCFSQHLKYQRIETYRVNKNSPEVSVGVSENRIASGKLTVEIVGFTYQRW